MTTKLNPQPGDIVHVRMTVSDIQESHHGNIAVAFKSNNGPTTGNYIYVSPSEILAIEPRPLKIGDQVGWQEGFNTVPYKGTIIALYPQRGFAWVDYAGPLYSVRTSALTKEP